MQKKNKKTTDIILVIMAIFLLVFTVTMIVIFCVYNEEPSTLITCVFGACTGELSILGWIKSTKIKNMEDSEDGETEE